MTDNLDEGKQGEAGGVAPTTPSATPAQPLTGDVASLAATVKALQGEIAALKGGKDAAVNRMEKAVAPLLDYAKYLPNVSEEEIAEARRKAALDEFIAEKYGQNQPAPSSPAQVTPPAAQVDAQSIVTALQLNANDPDVAKIVVEKTGPELIAALANVAVAKKLQPSPTPAQGAAPVGGVPPQETLDSLAAEYTKEVQANFGKREVIKAIQARYKAKGLDVTKIGFGPAGARQ